MAWNEIEYKCGHTEREQLHGPHTERERYIERASNKLCTTCYNANLAESRKEEAGNAALAAQSRSLPALTGSEKQVPWANTIRNDFVELLDQMKIDLPRYQVPGATPEELAFMVGILETQINLAESYVQEKTKAKTWIDKGDHSLMRPSQVPVEERAQALIGYKVGPMLKQQNFISRPERPNFMVLSKLMEMLTENEKEAATKRAKELRANAVREKEESEKARVAVELARIEKEEQEKSLFRLIEEEARQKGEKDAVERQEREELQARMDAEARKSIADYEAKQLAHLSLSYWTSDQLEEYQNAVIALDEPLENSESELKRYQKIFDKFAEFRALHGQAGVDEVMERADKKPTSEKRIQKSSNTAQRLNEKYTGAKATKKEKKKEKVAPIGEHGGARPGAGRPAGPEQKIVSTRVTTEEATQLFFRAQSLGLTLSAYLSKVLKTVAHKGISIE